MKIMIVSDTHGNYLAPLTLLGDAEIGLLIHLGDEISDAKALQPLLEIPLLMIPGNCDHSATEPRELIITIAGNRFLITHGDSYRVKNGLENLVSRAVEKQVAVVLFGHTHVPCIQERDGILLVNPGTLMSRSAAKSYALLTVKDAAITAEIIQLP